MTAPDGRLTGLQLAVASAALDGDSGAAFHIVREVLAEGMPLPNVLYDVLRPVLTDLGKRWLDGDYLISEEHAASNVIETVVSLLAGSFEQPEDGTHVVVGCVEGETHVLPGRFLAAHLLHDGYRTTLLGATMPAADLRQFLTEVTADALILTCTMSAHLTGARASIAAGRAAGVPVIVGGAGFGASGQWAAKVGADIWVARLQDIPQALESLPVEPASVATGEVPDELRLLEDGHLQILAAASASFEGGRAETDPRHRAELSQLFDSLAASAAVDDDKVILDFAGWLAPKLADGDPGATTAFDLIEALRDAVRDVSPEAARRLESAAAALG